MDAIIKSIYRAKSRYVAVTSIRASRGLASPRLCGPPLFYFLRGPHLARQISTASKEESSSGRKHVTTQYKYLLTLSTSAALSWLFYAQQQGTVQLDSGEKFVQKKEAPVSSKKMTEAAESLDTVNLPTEKAVLTTAPNIPPPITRDYPVLLDVDLATVTKLEQLTNQYKYEKWTYNNSVPGPFIRARVGDVVNLRITNHDESGMPHNIDCHAFFGPGGGAPLTTVNEGETKTARFKLQRPGLYNYHCSVGPVGVHIANGMYGLIYVQPEQDLPTVDKEYYVMQSEFYHEPPERDDNGQLSSTVEFSWPHALREAADVVVFNGSEAALTEKPLKARLDDTVRIYFGNGGPNLTSSFHVIGSCFDHVYRDADVLSPPGQCVQTVSVPPGGSTIVDMKMVVPGTYTIVDHAIFRLEKGAKAFLNVSGEPRPQFYQSKQPAQPCEGCKLHP
ncbi:putative multicopper oxidase [Aspergillus alliaceus]|uniref:putative multicopper oxidase n=1 Tax=Petromyces alliaceus TaxID=209559 RepID=UPI0012A50AE1|nr:Cupredoxin [Aspergillus alliaceus]KAB8233857.1 Cupredoxin [Aspergillus alliaceus]